MKTKNDYVVKKPNISLSVSQELKDRIDLEAGLSNMTRSQFVNELMEYGIEKGLIAEVFKEKFNRLQK